MIADFKSIEKHFPYETMRREQRAALAEVDAGWRNMKKYAVLELPTGVGKSAIAMAIARAVAASCTHRAQRYIVTGSCTKRLFRNANELQRSENDTATPSSRARMDGHKVYADQPAPAPRSYLHA